MAYVTVGAIGALVGALFAVVTRYLRKWMALAAWAVVFFVSLAMVVLVASNPHRDVAWSLSSPVLLSSAVFGLLISFSLPIRRRH
jgi:hypothetical protein